MLKVWEVWRTEAAAGDPLKGTQWVRKTLRPLKKELKRKGFQVAAETVRRWLRVMGYALRVHRKRLSQKPDPKRDRPMRYIIRRRPAFLKAGKPVISVDTQKKEWIGNFKNAGRTWRPEPLAVLEKDFPRDADGKAIPYGIYDLKRHQGFVVIGTAHETAQCAGAALRRGWREVGRVQYPGHSELLIEADGGGANGARRGLWKASLQALADEFQMTITGTHFPPGASQWNPVAHRMFSLIRQNWAGQPWVSYETVLNFIRTAKTENGFRCGARLDTTDYGTGVKVSPEMRAQINLVPHKVFPKWNYTIKPHAKPC